MRAGAFAGLVVRPLAFLAELVLAFVAPVFADLLATITDTPYMESSAGGRSAGRCDEDNVLGNSIERGDTIILLRAAAMAAMFLVGAIVPQSVALEDTVDTVELNHYYDGDGRLVVLGLEPGHVPSRRSGLSDAQSG